MEISKQLLRKFPLRRHCHPNHDFFDDGNQAFCAYEKTVDEDIDFIVDSIKTVHIEEFSCTIKGCLKTFTSPVQFNRHYDMLHRFCCQTCSRNFPSNYLLSLHISENHDTYFEAQKEKGVASFYCLIESCGCKFASENERKNHLVKTHKYPPDFRFNAVKRKHKKYQKKETNGKNQNIKTNIKQGGVNETSMDVATDTKILNENKGILEDKTKKKKNRKKKGSKKCEMDVELPVTTETTSDVVDVVVDDKSQQNLAETMDVQPSVESSFENKKRTLPKSICFGRGIQRGFSHTRHKR